MLPRSCMECSDETSMQGPVREMCVLAGSMHVNSVTESVCYNGFYRSNGYLTIDK
jgi:hypothetical protein